MLLSSSLVWAPKAGASKPAVLAVGDCSDPSSAAAAKRLREALPEAFPEAEMAKRLGGTAFTPLSDVERLLAGARYDLYESDAKERAQRTLESALDELLLHPASPESADVLRAVRTALAFVSLKRSREADAAQHLLTLIRVDPSYTPDPALYAPSFRRFAERVRSEQNNKPKAGLKVTSRPSGHPIFVDGLLSGKTPRRLELAEGEYQVVVARGGVPKKIVLTRGESDLTVDVDFESSIHADKGPCLENASKTESIVQDAVRVANMIGVDQLITVAVNESAGYRSFTASLIDVSNQRRIRSGRFNEQSGAAARQSLRHLAEFLMTGTMTSSVERVDNHASASRELIVSQKAKGVSPGTIASGGVGVATGALAGILFLQAFESNRSMESLCSQSVCVPSSVSEYRTLASTRGTLRTAATVLTVISGTAFAAGALFYILSTDPSGPRITLTDKSIGVSATF